MKGDNMYIITQIVGCLIMAISLAYTRDVGFGIKSYLVFVAAQVMFIGWLFPYSYGHAPNLFAPWFIGSSSMAIFGLLISYFWFGDVISVRNYIGIGTVFLGTYLLIT
jgi:hypothetical protein